VRSVTNETATIYDWGGGREAFARWLNRFYDLVELEAPAIAAMFGGRVSLDHREHVTDWWVEVMGGPATYTEQRGGYERMLAHHHNLAITPEQRLTFVTLLSRAADDVGLPADPEFRAAIMGYAEWGTRPTTPNPGRKRSPRPLCRDGDGESHRPTSRLTPNPDATSRTLRLSQKERHVGVLEI
jgi:hemoglobin